MVLYCVHKYQILIEWITACYIEYLSSVYFCPAERFLVPLSLHTFPFIAIMKLQISKHNQIHCRVFNIHFLTKCYIKLSRLLSCEGIFNFWYFVWSLIFNVQFQKHFTTNIRSWYFPFPGESITFSSLKNGV